jgi:hypothetical protein
MVAITYYAASLIGKIAETLHIIGLRILINLNTDSGRT